MRNTEERSSSIVEEEALNRTRSTDSNGKSALQIEDAVTLGPLSKDLATHLLGLAKKITQNEVTPKTVHAACACASELYKIMKLNWEMKKR